MEDRLGEAVGTGYTGRGEDGGGPCFSGASGKAQGESSHRESFDPAQAGPSIWRDGHIGLAAALTGG